jgi:hypothetical protein
MKQWLAGTKDSQIALTADKDLRRRRMFEYVGFTAAVR